PDLADGTVEVAARREVLDRAADAFERLELGSDEQLPMLVAAGVERADADRIAGDEVSALVAVPQGEGEDAVEVVEQRRPLLAPERQDHLAVGGGLERVR